MISEKSDMSGTNSMNENDDRNERNYPDKSTDSPVGRLIVFEGIDGSGKSTQIRKLMDRLSSMGIKCSETKEPTDSPIGSLVRQILTGEVQADNKVIASLFMADRVGHLLNTTDGICAQINKGTTVLSDRYYFSSYAYQGVDLDMQWIIDGNSISANILRPALTVFLDVPVKEAMERINRGRSHTELYETEESLAKVREKYFEAFAMLKDVENVAIVDADADVDTVAERIWDRVSCFFALTII